MERWNAASLPDAIMFGASPKLFCEGTAERRKMGIADHMGNSSRHIARRRLTEK
ncbi:MAG: hypothetical protein LH647_13365 [Leptolyngbyaceae cyanobacterium CAN_BIN12]|nr:hypothetical protein [Leptolyngbyaceae cyanobacterium CAN_BIN12]